MFFNSHGEMLCSCKKWLFQYLPSQKTCQSLALGVRLLNTTENGYQTLKTPQYNLLVVCRHTDAE